MAIHSEYPKVSCDVLQNGHPVSTPATVYVQSSVRRCLGLLVAALCAAVPHQQRWFVFRCKVFVFDACTRVRVSRLKVPTAQRFIEATLAYMRRFAQLLSVLF